MPFPGVVGELGGVLDGVLPTLDVVPPMIPTQTYQFGNNPLQSLLTSGFQAKKSLRDMPFAVAMP